MLSLNLQTYRNDHVYIYFPFALSIFIVFIELVLNSYSHRTPSLPSVQSDIQYDLTLIRQDTGLELLSNAVRDHMMDSN